MNERIFEAIGSVDPELLARSERRRQSRYWTWMAAAACLTVLAVLGRLWVQPGAPEEAPPFLSTVEEEMPNTVSVEGKLHLLSSVSQAAPKSDFLIYVNEAKYTISETEGAYAIRPILPVPEGCPPCELIIYHEDQPPVQAAETVVTEMAEHYMEVSLVEEADIAADNLRILVSDGTDWDAAQLEVCLVDDGQGGTYLLTSRYFTEAEEGHGVSFRDMVGTFQVVDANEVTPDWMRSLRQTTERLLPALFAGDLSQVSDLLAEDAIADVYGRNVRPEVVVASVDYALDGEGEIPDHAIVSVKHRLSNEEPYQYLTMEIIRQEEQWELIWAGLAS